MRSITVLLLAVLLLAGCSGTDDPSTPAQPLGFDDDAPTDPQQGPGEEPSNETPPPAAEDRGPAVMQFTGSYDVTVTQLVANGHRFNVDPNCVNFGKGTVWLVFNGTAEAVWTATSQFSQRLEVEIWDGGGQGRLYTNDGAASPSRLDFGQFRITQASTLGLAFIVQPSDNGPVVQQPVKITISFNYIGRPDLSAKAVPCVYPEPSIGEEVAS